MLFCPLDVNQAFYPCSGRILIFPEVGIQISPEELDSYIYSFHVYLKQTKKRFVWNLVLQFQTLLLFRRPSPAKCFDLLYLGMQELLILTTLVGLFWEPQE